MAGCAGVEIRPTAHPRADLPEPQFTAATVWLSNDSRIPKARMLRAAVRACAGAERQDVALPVGEPYGVHGTWFLDFACRAGSLKAGDG